MQANAANVTKTKIIQSVVLLGMIISGFISIIVVSGVVYAAIAHGKAPEVLVNWGGIILGFFFGQFFSYVQHVTVQTNNGIENSDTN